MDRRGIRNIKEYGKFSKILVTGPQRSGTRIGAKIIAHETGHIYVDEDDFEVNKSHIFEKILLSHNIVVQCPGICYNIHNYSNDDTLIVLMIRSIKNIIESEKRIGWETGPYQEYENYGVKRKVAKYYRGRDLKPISKLKYNYWYDFQKAKIKNSEELIYESLSNHSLWIDKENRKNWNVNQTS